MAPRPPHFSGRDRPKVGSGGRKFRSSWSTLPLVSMVLPHIPHSVPLPVPKSPHLVPKVVDDAPSAPVVSSAPAAVHYDRRQCHGPGCHPILLTKWLETHPILFPIHQFLLQSLQFLFLHHRSLTHGSRLSPFSFCCCLIGSCSRLIGSSYRLFGAWFLCPCHISSYVLSSNSSLICSCSSLSTNPVLQHRPSDQRSDQSLLLAWRGGCPP